MTADGDVFNPPAELARVHIRTAVDSVLQYPPAQGKYALDKLLADVNSEYFPETEEKAITAFKNSPLVKPRESLVRNFVIVLLKRLINEIDEIKKCKQYVSALNATKAMHNEIYQATIGSKLSDLLRGLTDETLYKIILIVRYFPQFWDYTDDDIRGKISTFVENLPAAYLGDLDDFLDFEPLEKAARKRAKKTTFKELRDTVFFVLHEAVADRMIELYLKSTSYDQANQRAVLITNNANDFGDNQIETIVKGAGENGQIRGSFELGSVINAFKQRKGFNKTKFNNLLKESDLSKYSFVDDTEAD